MKATIKNQNPQLNLQTDQAVDVDCGIEFEGRALNHAGIPLSALLLGNADPDPTVHVVHALKVLT
eukprot:m.1341421 g.1341421  ORF g.1341421 m.1341421 type:complete len:65 (-) comp24895_c0_seq4:34-228(-)